MNTDVGNVSPRPGIIPLIATRFRPNQVIDGPPAFSEFDWVKQKQSLMVSGGGRLRALTRTVRCRATGIDPEEPGGREEIDLPALLAKHFPEHGPYLGIYACLEEAPLSLRVGDTLAVTPPMT